MPETGKELLIALARDLRLAATRYQKIAEAAPEQDKTGLNLKATFAETFAHALEVASLTDAEVQQLIERNYPPLTHAKIDVWP